MTGFPPLEGVEHRFADARGVRLHYVDGGSGEPVLLLHGWPQHHWAWRLVIPRLLEAGHRVIAPDLRGFGWSDAPRSSYEKDELARDVIAFMDEIGLARAVVAGHDWGGYVAFLAAVREPGRFERIEGFAINHPWANTPSPMAIATGLAYQPLIATPVLGPLAQRFSPYLQVLHRIGGLPERRLYLSQFREPARAEAGSRLYRSFLLRELRGSPPGRVEVPSRITIGSRDPVISVAMLEGTESRFAAGLEIEVLDGAGHWLPEERAEEVAARILTAPA